jgi:predicted 2-oxoglutarate/Fe(II)-dependent dioxygenase YbiX
MAFTHIEIPNFLTKEECNKILDFSLNNLELKPGVTGPTGELSKYRKSSIELYPYYNKFPFLLEKISKVVDEYINVKGHDLEYRKEKFQFTQYKVGEYYNWHGDREPGGKNDILISGRYCTIVIQLNDEYNDGNLELELFNGEHVIVEKGIGNMVIFLAELKHRVVPVSYGERYTLVNWIGIKPKENYKKTLI